MCLQGLYDTKNSMLKKKNMGAMMSDRVSWAGYVWRLDGIIWELAR